MYKLGDERLENCPAERNSGVLVDGKLKSTACPGSKRALTSKFLSTNIYFLSMYIYFLKMSRVHYTENGNIVNTW